MNLRLYEILVPCQTNDGKPIRTRQHKEWDRRVQRITGGLTVMPPTKGRWTSPRGQIFAERMIPVRIMTSFDNMDKICDMTAEFYQQEAIMFFEISNNVQVRYYGSSST